MHIKKLPIFLLFVTVLAANAQVQPQLAIESGKEMFTSAGWARDVVFSENSRNMALISDKEIRIYDLSTGLLIKRIGANDNFYNVHFSNDLKRFRFTRLRTGSEPDEREAFSMVRATFSDSVFLKRPYSQNGPYTVEMPIGNYFYVMSGDSLSFMRYGNSDTVLFNAPDWAMSRDEKQLLLFHGSDRSQLLDLETFDTLQFVSFTKMTKRAAASLSTQKDNYSYNNRPDFLDNRFIRLTTSGINATLIRIFDKQADSVIFAKYYQPEGLYDDMIFLRPIVFSAATGIITLPSKNGLEIHNIYTHESFTLPLKKSKLKSDLFITADGHHLIINTRNEEVRIYSIQERKFIQTFEGSFNCLVNPVYPLIYLSRSSVFDKQPCLVFDLNSKKVVEIPGGEMIATSNNGKIVYGKIDLNSFLLNENLQPIKAINTCTPVISAIREVGNGNLIFAEDRSCDFQNKMEWGKMDFYVWDINRLKRFSVQEKKNSYEFSSLKGYGIYNDNFYFSQGYSNLESLTDTAEITAINRRFGVIQKVSSNSIVFKESFALPSGEFTDSIYILKNPYEICAKFNIMKEAFIEKIDVESNDSMLVVLHGRDYMTNFQKLTWWNFKGEKVKEHILRTADDLDYFEISSVQSSKSGEFAQISGTSSGSGGHLIFRLSDGKMIKSFTNENLYSELKINLEKGMYAFSDENSFLRIGSFKNSGREKTYNVQVLAINQSLLLSYKPPGTLANYSPASLMTRQPGTSQLYFTNWTTSDTLKTIPIAEGFIYTTAISNDGKWISYVNLKGEIYVVHVPSGLTKKLPGHLNDIRYLLFTADGTRLVSSGNDGIIKIWSLITFAEIISIFNLNAKDFVITSPDGYYQSTKTAYSKFGFSVGTNVVSASQLDLMFNRPDILLKKVGCPDTMLIQAYYHAWSKRIKKMGFKETDLASNIPEAPELTITNADHIPLEAQTDKLILKIKCLTGKIPMAYLNVWVNQTPVYGRNGLKISEKHAHALDTSIVVTLAPGANRIEIAAINAFGIESPRKPVAVNYTPIHPTKAKIFFVGIGLDRFKDSRYNLNWSVKDITDLSAKLKEKHGDNIEIDTFFNQGITLSRLKALKQKLLQSSVNDKVIIAYSGHGLLSKDYDYYLSLYDVDFDNPQQGGLPYAELENLLDGIPARKKLMFIDACHSGEVDKDELSKMTRVQEQLDSTTRGATVIINPNKKLGIKSSFELMQELFVDVGRSTGATIISAAAGTQFALERGDLKNGVFTYSILEAMEKSKTIKVSELKRIVSLRVEELTQGLQKPTFRNETIDFDWEVW